MSDLNEVENLPLRSEFLRAINLITTTQLTLFLDREPPTRESMVADFKPVSYTHLTLPTTPYV